MTKSTHWSEAVKQAEAEGYARGLAQGRQEGFAEAREKVLKVRTTRQFPGAPELCDIGDVLRALKARQASEEGHE